MDPVSKAQSSAGNSDRYSRLRPYSFKPGKSGNPNGRPKKAPITKIFERIFRKAKNRKDIEEAILKILLQGKMASVLMLREGAERIEGKVTEKLEVTGEINTLSDADLAEKIAKLTQK